MDSDDVNIYDIDSNMLKKHIIDNKINNVWDVLSFGRLNLTDGYYDIWALVYEPFIHNVWADRKSVV